MNDVAFPSDILLTSTETHHNGVKRCENKPHDSVASSTNGSVYITGEVRNTRKKKRSRCCLKHLSNEKIRPPVDPKQESPSIRLNFTAPFKGPVTVVRETTNNSSTNIPYLPPMYTNRIYRLLMDSPRSFSEKYTNERVNIGQRLSMCKKFINSTWRSADICNKVSDGTFHRDSTQSSSITGYLNTNKVSKRMINSCSSDSLSECETFYHPLDPAYYSSSGKFSQHTYDCEQHDICEASSCSDCDEHLKDMEIDGPESGRVSVEDLHEVLNRSTERYPINDSDIYMNAQTYAACPVKIIGSLATKRWIAAVKEQESVQKWKQLLRKRHLLRSTGVIDTSREFIDKIILETIDPKLPDHKEVFAAMLNEMAGMINCGNSASEQRMHRSMTIRDIVGVTKSCEKDVVLSYLGSDKVWSTTKRLGFPSPTNPEQLEAEVKAYIRLVHQEKICERQWNSALQGVPLFGSATLDTCELLRKLSRKHCIPASLRGLMWMTLSGVSLKMDENSGFFKLIINKFGMSQDTNYDIIERDLGRTFPDHPYFAPEDTGRPEGIGVKRLRLILHALCWRNPLLGYCQSFNFIAAVLLLVFDDDEATFFMMCHILEHLLPNDYYSEGLFGVKVDQEVFVDLLWNHCPKIAEHFSHLKFSAEALVPSWIMSLYVNVFPVETVLRVWDCMLTEGGNYYSAVPLSILIAFLKIHSDIVLKTVDAGDLMVILNHLASIEYDWDKLVKYAQDINLKPSDLHNSRRKVRDDLLIEAERRKRAKNEYIDKLQPKMTAIQREKSENNKVTKRDHHSSNGDECYELSTSTSYAILSDEKGEEKSNLSTFKERSLAYVVVERCTHQDCSRQDLKEVNTDKVIVEPHLVSRKYKVVGFQFDGSRRKALLDSNGNVICVASDVIMSADGAEYQNETSISTCDRDNGKGSCPGQDITVTCQTLVPLHTSSDGISCNNTNESAATWEDNRLSFSANTIDVPLPPSDVVNTTFTSPFMSPTSLATDTIPSPLNMSDMGNTLRQCGSDVTADSRPSERSKNYNNLEIEMKEISTNVRASTFHSQ